MFLLVVFVSIAFSQRFLAPDEDLTDNPQCYGSIFDAGSSGTRVYIYQWDCRTSKSMPLVNLTESKYDKKVTPGLASFDNNLDNIGSYLEPLINFIYEIVPQNVYKYTPIMLGATAGMRVLPQTNQTAIINTVNTVFNSTQLLYNSSWIRVITGQEEGMYMWMSIYYLLNETQQNLLTIDLGGASTQNAFKYAGSTSDFILLNAPPNITDLSLYSVTYLGYGNDMARNAIIAYSIQDGSNIISTPCYANGYTNTWDQNITFTLIGTGNLTACYELIEQYLNTQTNTSINGTYEPPVTDQTVYAANGVVSIASFFNLTSFTENDYYLQMETFTNMSWSDQNDAYPNNPYLATNYFLSIYVYGLLKDGYNIPSTTTINAPSTISGLTPSWTLAACAYQLGQIQCTEDSPVCQFQHSNILYMMMTLIYIILN